MEHYFRGIGPAITLHQRFAGKNFSNWRSHENSSNQHRKTYFLAADFSAKQGEWSAVLRRIVAGTRLELAERQLSQTPAEACSIVPRLG
jgi:hypothetical protein